MNIKEVIKSNNKYEMFIKRFVASIIDYILLIIIFGLCYYKISNEKMDLKYLVLDCLIFIFYFSFEGTKFSTIGKRIMRIVVVDKNLEIISKKKVILKSTFKILDLFSFGINLFVFFLTQNQQKIGDLVTSSFVVKRSDLNLKNSSENETIIENYKLNEMDSGVKITLSVFNFVFLFLFLITIGFVAIKDTKNTNNIGVNNKYSNNIKLTKELGMNFKVKVTDNWELKSYSINSLQLYNKKLLSQIDIKPSDTKKGGSTTDIFNNLIDVFSISEYSDICNIAINGTNAHQIIAECPRSKMLITIIDIGNTNYTITATSPKLFFEKNLGELYAITRSLNSGIVIRNKDKKDLIKEVHEYLLQKDSYKALLEYNNYLTSKNTDEEILVKKAELYFKIEDYYNAYYTYNELINIYPNTLNYRIKQIECMINIDEDKESIEKKLNQITTRTIEKIEIEALFKFYYSEEKDSLQKSISLLEEAQKKAKNNIENSRILSKKAKFKYVTLLSKNNEQSAKLDTNEVVTLCNDALRINDTNIEALDILAYIKRFNYDYNGAIKIFEESSRKDPVSVNSSYSIAKTYYFKKNYNYCIKFTEDLLDKFENHYDLSILLGDCYVQIGDHQKAIQKYKKIEKYYPKDLKLLYYIAAEHYYLNEMSIAKDYVKKVLTLDKDYEAAKVLEKYILEIDGKDNIEELIEQIRKNYLYFDKIQNFEQKCEKLRKSYGTNKDMSEFVKSIKLSDDKFTYFIDGMDYSKIDNIKNVKSVVSNKVNPNTTYFSINEFTFSTGADFVEELEKIQNTENHNLIIDLRNNPGGLIDPTIDILDVLLPECVSSYTVSKDGKINDYYSDPYQIKFNKIYIFVNEMSASSSELLTLGLKKYLSNVTIIGKPTYGKGVGQIVLDNRTHYYLLYLVNFYWNVKEENIAGKQIKPDILVSKEKLEEYMSKVK